MDRGPPMMDMGGPMMMDMGEPSCCKANLQ